MTTRSNALWQTDFTHRKVIGWGRFYLSTILDIRSRYIVPLKHCMPMQAMEVAETLEDALVAPGCNRATVAHRRQLTSELPMDAQLDRAPLVMAAATFSRNWPTRLPERAWNMSMAPPPGPLRHRVRSDVGSRP